MRSGAAASAAPDAAALRRARLAPYAFSRLPPGDAWVEEDGALLPEVSALEGLPDYSANLRYPASA